MMKKTYTKPEIKRIDLQDRQMLSMSTNCKSELPETLNCCYVSLNPDPGLDCEDPLGGGVPTGAPISDIGS